MDSVEPDVPIRIDDHVAVWFDSGGGVTIKAIEPSGDPVEISASQARSLAEALVRLAELDEADG
jgi:hypothetical protein